MKPRPKDPNQLAKLIVDIATGEASDDPDELDTSEPATKSGEDAEPKQLKRKESTEKGNGPMSGSGSR